MQKLCERYALQMPKNCQRRSFQDGGEPLGISKPHLCPTGSCGSAQAIIPQDIMKILYARFGFLLFLAPSCLRTFLAADLTDTHLSDQLVPLPANSLNQMELRKVQLLNMCRFVAAVNWANVLHAGPQVSFLLHVCFVLLAPAEPPVIDSLCQSHACHSNCCSPQADQRFSGLAHRSLSTLRYQAFL